MPKNYRELFAVAYLLCRAADTIADTSVIPREIKLSAIKKFPEIVKFPDENKSFTGELTKKIPTVSKLKHERILIEILPDILKTLSKLTKAEKELIHTVVSEVCKGMETDLSYFDAAGGIKAFETSVQLENYCRLIGGAPGAFWAKSLILKSRIGQNEKNIIRSAVMTGDALQITNILRDIPSDIKNGRCYLPLEDLKRVNLTAKDLLNPASINALKPIIKKWIKWAVKRLDCAEEFISLIPKKDFLFKAATIWPIYWCLDTLQEIYKSDELLKPGFKAKITRTSVYLTILKTPPALLSNSYFNQGFRFRREALLSSMSG